MLAVKGKEQCTGNIPSNVVVDISSRTDAANTQNAEITSKEHSKTKLQILNHDDLLVKVHEIDFGCEKDSLKINMNKKEVE
ncbi:MAG: hypothetical protein ACI8WP_001691 [Flavobacteriaceae bacterium]